MMHGEKSFVLGKDIVRSAVASDERGEPKGDVFISA